MKGCGGFLLPFSLCHAIIIRMNKSTARKVLGLTGTEDIKTIKTKYRKLMHEIHPDSGSDAADVDYAARINEAYNVLKDDSVPKKRECKNSVVRQIK